MLWIKDELNHADEMEQLLLIAMALEARFSPGVSLFIGKAKFQRGKLHHYPTNIMECWQEDVY